MLGPSRVVKSFIAVESSASGSKRGCAPEVVNGMQYICIRDACSI